MRLRQQRKRPHPACRSHCKSQAGMARPWKHNEDRQERSLLFAEQGAATQKRGLSLCIYFPFVSDPQRSHFCLCAVAKQMTQQLF